MPRKNSNLEQHYDNVNNEPLKIDWDKVEQSFKEILSRRERLIVELVGIGLSNNDIAQRMGDERESIQVSISTVARKLGLLSIEDAEGSARSLLTQLCLRIKSKPELNAFDDSASNKIWGYKP